jgi:hypothetical protein
VSLHTTLLTLICLSDVLLKDRTQSNAMRFEVHKAIKMSTVVSLGVTSCSYNSLLTSCETYHFHLQGKMLVIT